MGQQIEAVFENGVFRPLQSVQLPEHHRVSLMLSEPEGVDSVVKNGTLHEEAESDREASYQSLPLQHCQSIRVKFKYTGDFAPLPYPIEEDVANAFDELEQP